MERYSMHKLCEILYLYMLMLCLLIVVEPESAKKYALRTMDYPSFDGIRLNSTDLGNLLAGITHADRYFDEDPIVLPLLQIKRLLRDIKNNDIDRLRTRSLIQKLQNLFKLNSAVYNKLRRDIVDYESCDPADRRMVADQLYHQMRRIDIRGDLVLDLHKYLDSRR